MSAAIAIGIWLCVGLEIALLIGAVFHLFGDDE
jgi:hypothetical protein